MNSRPTVSPVSTVRVGEDTHHQNRNHISPERSKAFWKKEGFVSGSHEEQRRPRNQQENQREEKSENSREGSSGRMASVLIVVALFMVTGVVVALLKPWEPKATAPVKQSALVNDSNLDAEFESLKTPVLGPLPSEVAESFTQATDPAERLRWCRDSGRVSSLLASFSEQALSEVPVSVNEMGEVATHSVGFSRFEVVFANGERRLLCVVRTDEGPRVDWESYARHSNALATWDMEVKALKQAQELVEQAGKDNETAKQWAAQQVAAMPKPSKIKPTAAQAKAAEKERLDQAWRVKLARDQEVAAQEELTKREAEVAALLSTTTEATAEVRVFVSAVNYYNFRFSDDEAWRSFRLTSPDSEESFTAYVAADSISAQILGGAVANGGSSQRVTLKLSSRPEDALRQQYQIESVLATGWVKAEGDYEADWLASTRAAQRAR